MSSATRKYDVAIIGSGIGGSTLAAIPARQGLSVIVFEGGTYPRFAIGESMILETSEVMRALAEFYDVPELAYYSSGNFYPYIGTSHGVKRHFSLIYHSPEEEGPCPGARIDQTAKAIRIIGLILMVLNWASENVLFETWGRE